MREMKGFYDIEFMGDEFEDEYPRDKYVDEAKADLLEFFNENKNETFYLKQILMFFEKRWTAPSKWTTIIDLIRNR